MTNSAGENSKWAGDFENIIVRNYRALATEAQRVAYWQALPYADIRCPCHFDAFFRNFDHIGPLPPL